MRQEIDKRYLELAEKWMNGTITPEEEVIFAHWYNQDQDTPVALESDFATDEAALRQRIFERLRTRSKSAKAKNKLKSYRYPIAASIALFLLLSGYFGLSLYRSGSRSSDVLPGGNHALLTLADGMTIPLDKAKSGQLAAVSGIHITKTDDGTIVYTAVSSTSGNPSAKNRVSTPRGGKYRVLLSDGSTVWLNASSSISFPVVFNDTIRQVELVGEAYFDIKTDQHRPFHVVTSNHTVNVLGTSFNVCAYPDDANTSTTLVEGMVRVETAYERQLLKPGQQAAISSGVRININTVDVDAITAWKTGFFSFDNEDITEVMKKVSRWYDVDVVNQSEPRPFRFGGTFSCDKKLSELLRHLQEISDYHFTIKGRRIIVQ